MKLYWKKCTSFDKSTYYLLLLEDVDLSAFTIDKSSSNECRVRHLPLPHCLNMKEDDKERGVCSYTLAVLFYNADKTQYLCTSDLLHLYFDKVGDVKDLSLEEMEYMLQQDIKNKYMTPYIDFFHSLSNILGNEVENINEISHKE